MTVHYANGIEIALVAEYLFEFYGISGTFYNFAMINFMGFFFVLFLIRETRGLTDK